MTSDSEFNNSTVFVGTPQVSQHAPSASLTCVDESADESIKDFKATLTGGEIMLGRSPDNAVCIPHKRLSRRHARLFPEEDAWVIEDLNSTNGVFVNEEKVRRARLKDGDIVKLGPLPFRYQLEQSTPPTEAAPKQASPLGAEGTMYAGHAEVLASLAAAEKEAEGSEEQPTERPIPEKSVAKRKEKRGAIGPILRYLLILLVGIGLVAGVYFYLGHQRQQELDLLVKDYTFRLQKFLEEYEDGSGIPSQLGEEAEEIEKIRDLKARVDVEAKKYPTNLAFKELQAKLMFLKFERRFQALLRGQTNQYGKLVNAKKLVGETRAEVAALKQDSMAKNAIVEVLDLLDLADIVIQFKRFSRRFDSLKSGSINSGMMREQLREMLPEMQELKLQFIEIKKANRLLLSVTYTEFQNLINEVEKQDIRFVDSLRGRLRSQEN